MEQWYLTTDNDGGTINMASSSGGAFTLTGGAGDDTLIGNGGSDKIYGMGGVDI